MINPKWFSESNEATYCPEDNKLRLYVGRVPRDEYMALRGEGWTSTPKQGCDFVAVWTPEREDTAISYAGIIGDEDVAPAERAADRAERFGGYLGKRLSEAGSHADAFEAGPAVHGFQDPRTAERSAARHDRQADRAVNAWGKAEYWQRRTAGVIAHALYKDLPGVRMGRIKTLEAEQRKANKAHDEYVARFQAWRGVLAESDSVKAHALALTIANSCCGGYHYKHPRPESVKEYVREHGTSLYSLLTLEVDPITGHEAANLWLDGCVDPAGEDAGTTRQARWRNHYALRLAYENQMLEAQGGRLEQKDVEAGGKLAGKLILKVSKSPATGRVTSCAVLGPRVEGWHYKAANIPGTEWAEHRFDLERFSPSAYTAPTPESLAELEAVKARIKAGRVAVVPKAPPLVNPTMKDAERLQAVWNKSRLASGYHSAERCKASVLVVTAERFANAGLRDPIEKITDEGLKVWRSSVDKTACRVRHCDSDEGPRVIVLSDKPQKALPISWEHDSTRDIRYKIDRASTSSLPYIVSELGGTCPPLMSHGDMVALALSLVKKGKKPATVQPELAI